MIRGKAGGHSNGNSANSQGGFEKGETGLEGTKNGIYAGMSHA